jgi:hypothetical protein
MPKNWTAATMGAKGGSARVPKGFATLTPEQRKKIAKAAAKKRWGKKSTTTG